MRKTKRGNIKKKLAPIVVGVVVAAVLLPVVLGLLGALRSLQELGWWEALLAVGLYALAVAAVIAGVLAAMCQRLKEIDGGEEDEAKKY